VKNQPSLVWYSVSAWAAPYRALLPIRIIRYRPFPLRIIVQAPRPASRALRVAARWPTATLDPGRSALVLAATRGWPGVRAAARRRERCIPEARSIVPLACH
jgi:hypothetical protein